MRVLSVVGARPQFIKAAAVSRALRSCGVHEFLVHTGQHYDDNMSAVFFRELEVPEPDVDLGVGSGPHGIQTACLLEGIERVLLEQRPARVLVYGDTNSTLAGALAAAKLGLPVAHVEAGLRSFNRRMPEEINRILTDHVSDLLFAPTRTAFDRLLAEGIPAEHVLLTGDVMYDAALHYGRKAEAESGILERLGLQQRGFLLATVHRAENTDAPDRLRAIFEALALTARELQVVVPLHPRTRKALGGAATAAGVRIIDPVGYLDMTMLEKAARLIATDSGGVQKEAFFHGVPCVTLRTETEWVELIDAGWNRLAPASDARGIHEALMSMLGARLPGHRPQPYGNGDAAQQIARALLETRRGGGSA